MDSHGLCHDLCPRLTQDSCPDYMLKAEECLRMEEERVDQYIHVATKPKLLKEVETEVGHNSVAYNVV